MERLWALLRGIIHHWRILVNGSLLLAVMGLWNYNLPEKAVSPRTFLEVFGIFLTLAVARAWSDYERRPQLEFHRDARASPYFEEFKHPNGARTRYLRIGLTNKGDTNLPSVWLLLESCSLKSPAVHVEERLQPKGREGSEFPVAAHGTTVVDVLTEEVPPGKDYGDFSFAYALPLPYNRIPNPPQLVEITLRAEGGGPPHRCMMAFGMRRAYRLDDLRLLPVGRH